MPYFLTFVKRYDLLRFAGAIRLFSQMFTRVQSYADGLDSMPQVPGDVKGFLGKFLRKSKNSIFQNCKLYELGRRLIWYNLFVCTRKFNPTFGLFHGFCIL